MATLFVDNLTVLDFSYLDPRHGMVGESWIVDLELSGELDAMAMVFDFGRVKKTVKAYIDDTIDHCLVVPARHAGLEQAEDRDGQRHLDWRYAQGRIRMQAPAAAVVWLPAERVSPDSVTRFLDAGLRQVLPDNVRQWRLTLRQEDLGTAPCYHYSHGLRKHDGNCQRIAHGHRSPIQIHENGRRSRYWEKVWADRWENIYLGTRDDLIQTLLIEDIPHHHFGYDAPQGRFDLVIPEDHCYLLDEDTTVECLAEHLARELAREAPGQHFRVRAFEGVGKGALAEARQAPAPRRRP